MRKAYISSTGMYVPEKVVPNSYFNDLLGENVDTWLRENVHIEERRWCDENQSTVDLCEAAAIEALNKDNISAEDLDLIIVATDTPEYISPSTASKLQHKLGAIKAGTFDLNTACAGFVTALDVASKYIASDDQYNNVLVIGAYAMSKYLNLEDKKTVTLFADGAGAFLLKPTPDKDQGFLTSKLITKGQYCDWMGIYSGATHQPLSQEVLDQKDHKLKFVKKFPKELNAEMWTSMTKELCDKAGLTPGDIDHYFITQININSIWETMDRLDQPRGKAPTVMHKYGYTGSACIPMAFEKAFSEGQIQRGDNLIFIGSGGGLSFAGAIFKF
jgi:3-oxoacyl-[acyl-carrier-protein] synthase-3